ncbi:HNH endonuclease family protein [Galactobacter valiniphilus]|uniref:HNH endonuclease family protein n=1 Tax=Galactobacter valiniphilus TaxID=2676122 RepID=UPI003736ADFD
MPFPRSPRRALLPLLLVSALGLSACSGLGTLPIGSDGPTGSATATAAPGGTPGTRPSPAPSSTQAKPAPSSTAAAPSVSAPASVDGRPTVATALKQIPAKGRAPKTGYVRTEVFGAAWKDVDRNGCDTRNDILARDLTAVKYKPGTRECVVLSGALAEPYTGTTIHFVRGQGTSQAVQIDHVVALSDAWQKGAQELTQAQREQLANDPLNLLAVDGPSNARKSDGDAATWLPPKKSYRCAYVARQAAVKLKYGLWMTQGEKDAITRVISSCPTQTLPAA